MLTIFRSILGSSRPISLGIDFYESKHDTFCSRLKLSTLVLVEKTNSKTLFTQSITHPAVVSHPTKEFHPCLRCFHYANQMVFNVFKYIIEV